MSARIGEHFPWFAVVDDWCKRYASVIMVVTGVGTMVLASLLAVVALIVFNQQRNEHRHHREEAHSIRVQCLRTVEFGRPMGEDFARRHVFNAKQQQDFFSLIPKSCP